MEKVFNSEVFLWVKENFLRFKTKSPKFFKKWQYIAGILLATAKLPDLINSLALVGVHVPEVYNANVKLIITCCSITGLVMTKLTDQATLKIDSEGNIVKVVDADKLPFTAMKDAQHIEKVLNAK